ncbi:MAG: FHA domain-containing protein [Propionibacteriaceae bacterium]|nr:FHA domain-containing protein [Propionibacteriaceae bacterium]
MDLVELEYSPGQAVLVCGKTVAALVDLPFGHALVAQLYQAVYDRNDLDDILDVLVSPGLRAIKSFALASWSDSGCRMLVRGSFSAEGPEGRVNPSGLWADVSSNEAGPIQLIAASADGGWLPLAEGIVGACAVRIALSGAAAKSSVESVAGSSVEPVAGSHVESVAEDHDGSVVDGHHASVRERIASHASEHQKAVRAAAAVRTQVVEEPIRPVPPRPVAAAGVRPKNPSRTALPVDAAVPQHQEPVAPRPRHASPDSDLSPVDKDIPSVRVATGVASVGAATNANSVRAIRDQRPSRLASDLDLSPASQDQDLALAAVEVDLSQVTVDSPVPDVRPANADRPKPLLAGNSVLVSVPSPAVEAPSAPVGGLLIESVPWELDSASAAPPAASPPLPPPPPSAPSEVSPSESSPPTPAFFSSSGPTPSAAEGVTPEPGQARGDKMIMGMDPEEFEMTIDRRNLGTHPGQPETMVVAAYCPAGHLTPAYAGVCRTCGQAVEPQEPVVVARPPLGVLRLSNGDSVVLDRGAILGRSPRVPSGLTGEQPNLIRLVDPSKEISSQHLEVSLDFWHVLVTDLGSTNGTEVVLPGQPAVRLTPHDAMTIEPGTRVVLAEVQDFVFEVQ